MTVYTASNGLIAANDAALISIVSTDLPSTSGQRVILYHAARDKFVYYDPTATSGVFTPTNNPANGRWLYVSGQLTWNTITSDQNATASNGYIYNNSGGTSTITMPASPNSGDQVGVVLSVGTQINIAFNSKPFYGFSNNYCIKSGNGAGILAIFQYLNSTTGWVLTDSSLKDRGIVRAQFWDKFIFYFPFDGYNSDSVQELITTLQGSTISQIRRTINGKKQDGSYYSGGSFSSIPNSSFTKLGLGSYPSFGIIAGVSMASTVSGGTYPNIFSKVEGDNLRSFDLYINGDTQKFSFAVTSDGTTGSAARVVDIVQTINAGSSFFVHAYKDATNNLVGISLNNGSPVTVGMTASLFDNNSPARINSYKGETGFGYSVYNFHFVGATSSLLTSNELTEIYNSGKWIKYP